MKQEKPEILEWQEQDEQQENVGAAELTDGFLFHALVLRLGEETFAGPILQQIAGAQSFFAGCAVGSHASLPKRRAIWTLRGVAAVLFGLMTFFLPGITLVTLVLLFGAYALVDGIFNVVAFFRGELARIAVHAARRSFRFCFVPRGKTTTFLPRDVRLDRVAGRAILSTSANPETGCVPLTILGADTRLILTRRP